VSAPAASLLAGISPMMDIFESLESEVRCYCRTWDTVFERAAGSMIYSEDGREYVDFFSGAGALNYGHNHPALLRPLVEYLLSGAVVHSLDMKTVAKRRFLETFTS
jgi:diaminobutyrate-2-oxoglutarate transaminase